MSILKYFIQLLWPSSVKSLRRGLPKLDENYFWGSGSPPEKIDESIRAFTIKVSDEVIEDLQWRLKTTREFTPPLDGMAQEYGFNTKLLQDIVSFWREKYNWRDRETYLNQFPQFKTNIQGLDIHYIHVKPSLPSYIDIYPLLILHGWPGSVKEFYKIIPLLTKPLEDRNFAFEVIAPSLPGFGFSDAASKPGLGVSQMAVIFKNLMKRLDFDRYYLQGGDWGSQISTSLACLYPENVLGLHVNMCISFMHVTWLKLFLGSFWPRTVIDKENEDRLFPLRKLLRGLIYEGGYYHIQATKPDTVGVALNQSPAGLAAYILEKFSTGTNPNFRRREDGGLSDKFTYTDLLDNVMLYWVTNSATTAARIYAENMTKENRKLRIDNYPLSEEVPVAFIKAPWEILYLPDNILRDRYPNIIQSTNISNAGHFLAMEEPEVLAKDIFSAVEKMRSVET